MDPLTQGLLGAVAVQSLARRGEQRLAAVLGFAAGTLADLDVFIKSTEDPLLFLDYHRHFTHALAFVPVAATIFLALLWPWLPWLRRRSGLPQLSSGKVWLWLAVSYGTHGLLDACTTYGTRLLWPFSQARIAWNLVAVIDPGLTLPALALAVWAWKRRSAWLGRAALVWILAWICLGWMQRERADALLARVAAREGHEVERGGAKPTLFNPLLWRGVWQSGDRLFVAALRPGWLGADKVSPVESAPLFDRARDLPALDPASTAALDIERFRHFSDGWLMSLPGDPTGRPSIGDFRYGVLPGEIRPLWAIRLDLLNPHRHAEYLMMREIRPGDLRRFFNMVQGGPPLAPFPP